MQSKHIFTGALIISVFIIVGMYLSKSEEAIQAGIEQSSEELSEFSESYLPNTDIETKVQTALVLSPEVTAFDIEVKQVKDKIVLRGSVDSVEEKARASNIALQTEGVSDVDNQLKVVERGVDDAYDVSPASTSSIPLSK